MAKRNPMGYTWFASAPNKRGGTEVYAGRGNKSLNNFKSRSGKQSGNHGHYRIDKSGKASGRPGSRGTKWFGKL